MPRPLFDLSALNLSEDVLPEEELRALLPQDHEFRMLDGICCLDIEEKIVVGYKDWDDNPWWARGHIPGDPLMPGILMIEGCAQVASVLIKKLPGGWGSEGFVGLAGVDNARFRGIVKPNTRIHFTAKFHQQTSRLARYPAQALVDGKIMFEMDLLGAKF